MTNRLSLITILVAACSPLACTGGPSAPPVAPHGHAMPAGAAAKWNAPFVASSDRPFGEQMMETMERMNDGMARAPMSDDPDHDFVTMMIPHHQGGIDMAKVLLVHGKDPEMRRLAQAIITDQQNEIELMHLWLERHPDRARTATKEKTP